VQENPAQNLEILPMQPCCGQQDSDRDAAATDFRQLYTSLTKSLRSDVQVMLTSQLLLVIMPNS
jgi:hypothetical protein